MRYGILIVGWVIFFVVHSVLATEQSKVFFASKMGFYFKYYRFLYSVVAALTLGVILAWQFSMPQDYFIVSRFFKYFIAIPCSTFAAVLMGICIRKYFFRLSGVEVFYQHPGPPVLETHGIHKFVRHPLYAGTLLMIWSILLWFPSLANLISCVLITVYVRIGIIFEERRLVKIFGRKYEDYKNKTPMLFPYLIRYK